jgi:hypothetical protein
LRCPSNTKFIELFYLIRKKVPIPIYQEIANIFLKSNVYTFKFMFIHTISLHFYLNVSLKAQEYLNLSHLARMRPTKYIWYRLQD